MAESQRKQHDLNMKEKPDILEQAGRLPKIRQRHGAGLKISQCIKFKDTDVILTAAKRNVICQVRKVEVKNVGTTLKLWFRKSVIKVLMLRVQ